MLIQTERASWPIRYRIRGAESYALRVVALSGIEAANALAGCEDIDAPESRGSLMLCELMVASLYTGNERAFQSASEVMSLLSTEVTVLGNEVHDALSKCSPVYQLTDGRAWRNALEEGAAHIRNVSAAARVASCVDVVGGFQKPYRGPRPDRWFGKPIAELTDGQLMAYDAARAVFEKDK